MMLLPKTKTPRVAWLVVGPLANVLSVTAGSAQQTVPFRGSNPVAPTGIPAVPLPDTPVIYDTAEGQRIRVVVVARGMANPWSLAFLPDGSMLITERPGRLRIIRNGVLDPQPIVDNVPAVRAGSFSGLMDVVLHPRFAENQFVYLSYNKPLNEKQVTLGLTRGRWNGRALIDVQEIFVAGPGTGGASRLAFAPDGTLFMSTGGGGADGAQNPATHGGKVLRLKDDGSVPADNPFVGRADHAPEVYSLGHRNSLGLAIHPATGDLWQHEQGPNGGDEMNVIRPGVNYGWPLVSYGRKYDGPWQSNEFWRPGFEQPVVLWVPSIALSGLAFYSGERLPKWKGDVFVGGLRTGEIPGTGHLERILFNEKMEELRRESLLVDLRQRIREVRQGPDGLLYVLTDHDTDGAVLRIEPAP
jgi:glucose/arabinose dehydrogenase